MVFYGVSTANIRSALNKLSSHFWPVFGKYQTGFLLSERYSEDNYFSEIHDTKHQEFKQDQSPEDIYHQYCGINPTEMQTLFFMSLIHYKNGTVLIPKMNHLAGDGYSYFYFLTALAAASRRSSIPFKQNLMQHMLKPSHHRTILKDFLLKTNPATLPQAEENLTIEIESIPREKIRNMIKSAAAEHERRISSNDLLSALIVKNLCTRQKDSTGGNFQLTIPIDVRRQIKEYGFKFFGNGIYLNTINFKIEEIVKSSAESLAIKIREAMPGISKDSYIEYLEKMEKIIASGQTADIRPYDPARGCLVTNLSKMPIDKLNFGKGPPDLICLLTIEHNSAAVLADKENFILRLAYRK